MYQYDAADIGGVHVRLDLNVARISGTGVGKFDRDYIDATQY